MLLSVKHSATGVILRCKILDSTVTTGAGKTALAFNTPGLIISTIASNEAAATAYKQADDNIETISTLGSHAAPTSGKCGFKEVSSANHPGIYEIHLADARFAVGSAKHLLVSISGATGAAETDFLVPLNMEVNTSHIAGAAVSTTTAQIGANAVQIGASANAATRLAITALLSIECTVTGTPSATEIQVSTGVVNNLNDLVNGAVGVLYDGAGAKKRFIVEDYSGSGTVGTLTVSNLGSAVPSAGDKLYLF